MGTRAFLRAHAGDIPGPHIDVIDVIGGQGAVRDAAAADAVAAITPTS